MKKGIVYLMIIMLLALGFAGCGKSTDAEESPDTGNMGQYEGDAAIMSEAEAMMLFEEIYEINKYLEDGYTMQFDGSTVEIDGQTCICAEMGGEENGTFKVIGHYAAAWGSAYYRDPVSGEWTAVGFG
jgi:hypothetical protein